MDRKRAPFLSSSGIQKYGLIFLIVLFLTAAIHHVCSSSDVSSYFSIGFRGVPDNLAKRMKYQRDTISFQLNNLMKLYGQQNCQIHKLTMTDFRISDNGGWCEESSRPGSRLHSWDKGFSIALSEFLKGKTVGSFGDGPGDYKKHLDSLGQMKSYTAYDGAPYAEEVTKGLVEFLDLSAPQYGLPIFDWVVSVEVGEHIPAKYEDVYLDNLVRHAREGLIISWATPGQKGLSHVNNKPLNAVIKQLEKRNFHIDIKAGEPLRNASTVFWLQKNIHVYYRAPLSSLVEVDA
ncbi:unnamed protein product [Lymnaea stagnalis]|uniref:Methyltransferase type 11 domain-containing protein n=1 Tax=Lymnaea stagnalis TaxID=6523 RepID=A0AAV2IC04_LYMST